jgi:glycosyltransferase involved in cell wall biosynthesis
MIRYQHGLATKLAELKPAVVVTMCHSGTLSEWHILRLKRRLNFKLVAWQCGYEFNPGRLKRRVLGKFVPQFDHHLAYHTNAKHYAIEHGARADQVTVIHNTINESAIDCLPKETARNLLEQRYPELNGKKIVLYVGAVLEEKRLEIVFAALDILARPDLMFVLVGDGPHLDFIRQNYGQRDDLITTGRIVDGVGPYFDAADVFILPGTGGLAINEAMAHGLAVISGYADGSADDLVVDGKNGFRLQNVSADEIARCLHNSLSDPAVSRRMGEVGREMITGHFSFEHFIDRVIKVVADDK